MRRDPPTTSLLSYLDAEDAKFRLEITRISNQAPGVEAAQLPFLRVSDSGPTTCITAAKFVTDAGSVLKQVFLLQQKDEYRLLADEIWPINNADIDQFWQEAVARYSNQTAEKSWADSPLLLKDQIDDSGRLLSFQSLFYCVFRDVFFHPPCPQCGHDLQLCEDDQLLLNSELKAYSSSLNRYLYCSECIQRSGQTAFYSLKREFSDPPCLKNLPQLISDFGQLVLNTAMAVDFPCAACRENSKCYGPDNLAAKRIVPYGFYPFYGLVFKTATLHAVDFLMLLAGATPDELRRHLMQKREIGRLTLLDAYGSPGAEPSSCLLPPDNPKRFLEILYLKLSFLGELVQMISAGTGTPASFDVPFTVDDVWVTLPDHSHRLPGFWNFKLNIMDIRVQAGAGSSGRLSKYPPAYSHHLLGIIWFYVLLVNKRQPIEKVRAEVEQVMAAMSGPGQSFWVASQTKSRPMLDPVNIFWSPESGAMEAGWQKFWEKSMELGGELLAAGVEQDMAGLKNRFWPVLESLRKEIVDELLGGPAPAIAEETTTHDQAIASILVRLQKKWRAELKTTPDARDLDETIALSASEKAAIELNRPDIEPQKGPAAVIAPDNTPNRGSPEQPEKNEDETLILSPAAYPNSNKVNDKVPADGIFQETVVLSSKDLLKFTSTAEPALPMPNSDKKGFGATVVISPADNSMSEPQSEPGSFDNPEKDMDLNHKSLSSQEDEDELSKTVVLKPSPKKK
jgi:hypothetical protein